MVDRWDLVARLVERARAGDGEAFRSLLEIHHSALTSTFPLWVIPIARVFLKEHTNRRCVGCTLLAVAGICLMVVPAPYLRRAWAEILSFVQALAGPV